MCRYRRMPSLATVGRAPIDPMARRNVTVEQDMRRAIKNAKDALEKRKQYKRKRGKR